MDAAKHPPDNQLNRFIMGLWMFEHPHISGWKEPSMPTPSSDYRTIPLTRGQFTIVDAADFDWLNQWKWYADWSAFTETYYARRNCTVVGGVKAKSVKMHRAILGLVAGDRFDADHRNLNTLDNRRENLRICTRSQNRVNTGPRIDNAIGLKGVCWHKVTSKWIASIQYQGKKYHLGIFPTPQAAHDAYCEAAKRLHGEFARF